MKTRASRWKASIVLASIVSNQVLFAYGPEASIWEVRRQEQRRRSLRAGTGLLARGPSPAALFGPGGVGSLPVIEKCPVRSYAGSTPVPKGLGETCGVLFSAVPLASATIRKISLPSNKTPRGLIFHIQDVHRNLDAQTNISHVVTSLLNVQSGSPSVALVGLEGAFRPYDLSWLRSFPDPNAARIAAEDLLAQDKMSGPIFSLLTFPGAIPPVVGIDDLTHYTVNIDAYRRSLPSRDTVRSWVKDQQKALDELKVQTFPPALRAFDQTVQAYHRGHGSLGAYVRALDYKGGSPLAEPIALFLRALEMEETLDFKQVDRERTTLIETLSQKMNQTQTKDLIAHSVSYRAGQLSYGDFYRWLTRLCQEVGVSLSDYPAMGAYIRYVLLSESIDADALLRETDQRERDVFNQLAKTEDEKKIVDESHRFSLVMKLVDFALTPTEWAEYERTRSKTSIGFTLEPYETFYREAHARDTAMAENVVHSLATVQRPQGKETPFPISIVVTGGYHGPGLTEKLTKAGMAVVTVVPKIQKIDTAQGSSYLTVFAQEKTPLDKLFEGAKLFVADSPLTPDSAVFLSLVESGVTVSAGRSIEAGVLKFLDRHFSNINVHWAGAIAQIEATFKGKVLTVYYDPTKPLGRRASMDQSPDTWGERLSIAVASSNLKSMGKELRWFLSATFGPALVLSLALYSGVGLWAIVPQILLGFGAAQINWPTFLAQHETSKRIWLTHNPGKTPADYDRDLRERYWSIVLASELVSIGLSFCFLGGPAIEGWKAISGGAASWVFSLFLGPFLFHGTQNFLGSLYHGRSYVAAMALDGNESRPSRQTGDPWMSLSEIPVSLLKGRTVIVRTNLDDTQSSYDDMRMVLAAKTIRLLKNAGAKVVLLSHLGRPNHYKSALSLRSRATFIERMLDRDTTIKFLPGDRSSDFRWLSDSDKREISSMQDGDVVMLENTRFDSRETSIDTEERESMAKELVDIVGENALYVLDGFPVAHRFNTASIDGLAHLLPGVKGLWQILEEAQHNKFLERLNNPDARGKLTVLFGGGKLDKQVEIDDFCREHLRSGDTLIVGGLYSEKLVPGDLRSELEKRGVTILFPDPAERPLQDGKYSDVGPEFTRQTINAINNSQSIFWEGPLGLYRDPRSKSLEVARAIAKWAGADSAREAFISGGSTSFLFKKANEWDEVARTKAERITVSTGGGTSIYYFGHRGRLPGAEALQGWTGGAEENVELVDPVAYENLANIPPALLRGRLVIFRANLDGYKLENPLEDSHSVNLLGTVRKLNNAGAKIVLLSQSGNLSNEGSRSASDFSSIAASLAEELKINIPVLPGTGDGENFRLIGPGEQNHIRGMKEGEVVFLSNVSLDPRESSENPNDKGDLARDLATLGQNALYVQDEISEPHRTDATVAFLPNYLPGVKAVGKFSDGINLNGWDSAIRSKVKGQVDLNQDPTFWTRILRNPLYKGFVFYFDEKTGDYEIHPRENNPGDLADDPDDEISELFRIQYRVNVAWGATVDDSGRPMTSHFYFTHVDHKPLVIVFPKDGGNPQVFQGYTEQARSAMLNARAIAIHNPDRGKRPGGDTPGASREEAENDPKMLNITTDYILNHIPLEMYIKFDAADGRVYWKTANRAGYIPVDPNGNPQSQIDQVTLVRADKYVPQSELHSREAITDAVHTFFKHANPKKRQDAFRVGGNGWFYGVFKAGASQNVLHFHLLRLVAVIERAGRVFVGRAGKVTIGRLNDDEDARGLYFEIDSEEDSQELIQVLEIAYRQITQKGHSFNFFMAPHGISGLRVFVGDKIAGVPEGLFNNESAFCEFILSFIIDNPIFAFDLTDAQVEELNSSETNVAEWVIRNWENDAIKLKSDLLERCINSIDLVSNSKVEYQSLAKSILTEANRGTSRLDSLLSRTLRNKIAKARTPASKFGWQFFRVVNDFILAPIGETGLFFLLPAASGSLFFLGIGLVVFVGGHFWDDYLDGKSNNFSPPKALKNAFLLGVPRFWRATLLYAMPFALFLVPSELFPLLENIGFGSLLPLVQSSSLYEIAGTVASLHFASNLIKALHGFLVNKFPLMARRQDFRLILVLFTFPTVAFASNSFFTPSLPFQFLAGLPWMNILVSVFVVAPIWWFVHLVARFISVGGGNESDELEALDHLFGSGLPHWKMAEILNLIAQKTKNKNVARVAVLPLRAPWRHLEVNLSDLATRFRALGWNQLGTDMDQLQPSDEDSKWLIALARRDAYRMASVLSGGENPNLAKQQDKIVQLLKEAFPDIQNLSIENLGSPGLNQIHNIGLDFNNPGYSSAFVEELVYSFKSNPAMLQTGSATFPTTGQSLARLRAFANAKGRDASEENRIPVQLEVYAKEDLPVAVETIRLLAAVNKDQEIPVRLLLAGVDEHVIGALKNAAAGNNNVVVADRPVATSGSSTDVWSLNPQTLNQEFNTLKGQLNLPDDIALAVGLSEGIIFTKTDFDALNTMELDQSLKDALLRLLSLPMVPFHFNTMLKIISKAREGIDQSA